MGAGPAGVTGAAGGGRGVRPGRVGRGIGIFPAVTLTALVLFTAAVDRKLLHLLIARPFPHLLFAFLYALQVALSLLVLVLLCSPRPAPLPGRLGAGRAHAGPL